MRSKCNSWGCEYCAPIKKNALLDDISYGTQIIQEGGHRWRFMTLTTSYTSDQTKVGLYFKRFRSYLAKHGYRPQYFKTTEFTQTGLRHFHLIIDVFVPFNVIQAAWRAATEGTAYRVNIKKTQLRQAAGYLTKYLTKQSIFSHSFHEGEHRYSFSQKFPRLARPKPTGEWEFRLNPQNQGLLQKAAAELAERVKARRNWRELWTDATGRPPGKKTYIEGVRYL